MFCRKLKEHVDAPGFEKDNGLVVIAFGDVAAEAMLPKHVHSPCFDRVIVASVATKLSDVYRRDVAAGRKSYDTACAAPVTLVAMPTRLDGESMRHFAECAREEHVKRRSNPRSGSWRCASPLCCSDAPRATLARLCSD